MGVEQVDRTYTHTAGYQRAEYAGKPARSPTTSCRPAPAPSSRGRRRKNSSVSGVPPATACPRHTPFTQHTGFTRGHRAEHTGFTRGHRAEHAGFTRGHRAEHTGFTRWHRAEHAGFTRGHRTGEDYLPNPVHNTPRTSLPACLTRLDTLPTPQLHGIGDIPVVRVRRTEDGNARLRTAALPCQTPRRRAGTW